MRDSSRRGFPGRVLLGVGLLAFSAWALFTALLGDRSMSYAERDDWTAPTGGRVNYSEFTFRDRDRDGVYGVGDRPMAGIIVEMTGPRSSVRASSNLNGFANFPTAASWLQFAAKIRRPGDYSFRVLAPPGWSITSGNAEQTSRFVEMPGAIGDLASLPALSPVGLAPRLTISGRFLRPLAAGGTSSASGVVVATGPSGTPVEVRLSPEGAFEVEAAPGSWSLAVVDEARGARVERRVLVRDVPVRLAAILFGDPAPTEGSAGRVLDFENFDLHGVTKIPNGFAGLRWDSLNAIEIGFAEGEGYSNGALSGHYVAYSSSGQPVAISSGADGRAFDFVGASFSVGWTRAEGETLIVQASRAGVPLPEERIRLSSLGPVRFEAGYRGVDRVVLRTSRYWQFVVDDVEIGASDSPSP